MSFNKVKFGDVCSFVRGPFGGSLKKDSFVSEGYAVYEQQHAIYNQFDNIRYFIDDEKFKSMARFELKTGDLIMSCSGTMGKIAIVPKGVAKGIINQALLKISPSKVVDINYLKYWMESESFQNSINNTNGSAIQNVSSVKILKEVEVPLPPLETQKQIAAVLDKADQFRKDCQQMEKELNSLAQSVFVDMFGDPVTNPKGWEMKTIEGLITGDKYSLKRGPFGGAVKKQIFVPKGNLVYEQYHALNNDFSYQRYFIDDDKFEELKAFEVKPKDIIISCSGVNLGRLAEVPYGAPKGIINQALLKLTLNNKVMNNHMFIAIFSHPNFKQAFYGDFRGAAIPNFPPMSTFKEFKFISPPIEVQEKYLNRVSLIDQQIESNNILLEEANAGFNSLMQSAFKGELNLKEQAA